MPNLPVLDRFTTRAAGAGWDVVDLVHEDRVIAHCADQKIAQAIAWLLRGEYEVGMRLLLEDLNRIDCR